MWSGVGKSGWPMPRLMIERPCAASAFARASTSKAVSVPSTPMRPAISNMRTLRYGLGLCRNVAIIAADAKRCCAASRARPRAAHKEIRIKLLKSHDSDSKEQDITGADQVGRESNDRPIEPERRARNAQFPRIRISGHLPEIPRFRSEKQRQNSGITAERTAAYRPPLATKRSQTGGNQASLE